MNGRDCLIVAMLANRAWCRKTLYGAASLFVNVSETMASVGFFALAGQPCPVAGLSDRWCLG